MGAFAEWRSTVNRSALLLALFACAPPEGTPVGVTLGDGEVLVGEITTDELLLRGAFGDVYVPLEDVGMVLPVEGRTLADSHGHVTLWLRNGSELRGEWAEPELAMGIEVGGDVVPVDVPADRLQALQLQGGEDWPDDTMYRVRTTYGDDFVVDPSATRLTLVSPLGTFSPFLSECRSVGPVGAPDGDWRIELETGTVLVGHLDQDTIAFALPMGPEVVEVPLEALALLVRGTWHASGSGEAADEDLWSAPASSFGGVAPVAPRAPEARPALDEASGWFDNQRLQDAKR